MSTRSLHHLAVLAWLFLSSFILHPSAFADTSPYVIPFQGRLTNQQGAPYATGQYTIVFNIYGQAVGGSTLWTERHEKVGVTNGMISVFLGSITALPTTIGNPPVAFFSSVRYLGMTVDADDNPATADPEMVPRQMIVPAFHAKNADKMSSTFGSYDWSVVFGGLDPGTNFIPLAKIPVLTVDKLPDNIPNSKLEPNAALQNLNISGFSGVASGEIIMSSTANSSSLIAAGYSMVGTANLGNNIAETLPTAPIGPRWGSFIVWSGSEIIVWGGSQNGNGFAQYGDGARYNPSTRAWTMMTSTGAPSARGTANVASPRAVWTGQRMLIWGGFANLDSSGTGALYEPVSDSWSAITNTGAPSERMNFAAAWTGTYYLVWGGNHRLGGSNTMVGDGARYDPATNSWSPMSATGAPSARQLVACAWTGTELFVWSGENGGFLDNGALYNPTTNSWRAVATSGAPTARGGAACAWTGSKIIVWAGDDGTANPGGGIYDPGTNSWSALPDSPLLSRRVALVGVWTGDAFFVAGGQTPEGVAYDGSAAFYPGTSTWLVGPNVSPARTYSPGVWCPVLGTMVRFGGVTSALTDGNEINETSSVMPPRRVYLYQRP